MRERLAFTKMQGVGNDFVLIDGRARTGLDWPAVARHLCARRLCVGADGLLVLEHAPDADLAMRMHNPDGSPDVCGNGLRCVARFAVELGLVPDDCLTVRTRAGVRRAEVHRDASGCITAVTVVMGFPQFDPQSIPMLLSGQYVLDYPLRLPSGTVLPITALSTGSTHAVAFVPQLPEEPEFEAISRQVENHPLFPERASLMWVQQETSDRLKIRIWERGAGETLGCGTGACAAAVAATLRGDVPAGAPITVASTGGDLIIRWGEGQEILMTGPAERVFEGTISLPADCLLPAGRPL